MGWLRLVGSLKLHISFTEYRLFYRTLLQKSLIILRSLLIEATPYIYIHIYICVCMYIVSMQILHMILTYMHICI